MTSEENIAAQGINISDLGDVIRRQARVTKVIIALLVVNFVLLVGFAVMLSSLSGNIDQNSSNISGATVAAVEAKSAAVKADKDLEAALKASSDPKYRQSVLDALESIHRIEEKLDEHIKGKP